MRDAWPRLLAFAVIGVVFGAAALWPLEGAAWAGPALGYAAFTFAALAVFVLALPKAFGLPVQVFIAMVAGIAAGWGFRTAGAEAFIIEYLGVFGTLFILLLKVVIVPLIFVSIVCGVAGIGDVRKLGKLGVKTLVYYVGTTAIAVTIGLVMVNVMRPGIGRENLKEVREEAAAMEAAQEDVSLGLILQDEVFPKIIQNPIMAGQDVIAVIFFAILLGAALAALGSKADAALATFRGLDQALITIIMWVMALAPIGVFALMAKVITELGLDYLVTLAKYTVTVLGGLAAHFCVLTLLLIPLLARISPRRFLTGMAPAFEVSFSTSSSSATLPVTIRCATENVGADKNIANFMLPIGATVNMDGTALYVTVASIFIGQVYGIPMPLHSQVMIFLTAVMVSVGTAGIPGASIGLMAIILNAAGIPAEGVGIVIGVDRILDMSRTVVNITGDSVGSVVLSRSEGLLEDPAAKDYPPAE